MRVELSRKINTKTQTPGNFIPHFGETGFIKERDLFVGDKLYTWQVWQHDDVGVEEGDACTIGEALVVIEEKFGNGWKVNTR